jgi:hypothetical protein
VTGNTSTTSGLTVTLSRDQSSDCAIEAGALVLADQVRFLTISLSMVGTFTHGLTEHIVLTSSHILACFGGLKKLFSGIRLFFFSRKHWFSGLCFIFYKTSAGTLVCTVRYVVSMVPVPTLRAILEGLHGLALNFFISLLHIYSTFQS